MISQILATILGLLINGRFLLFLLGMMLGGMFTVSSSLVYEGSETLLTWWSIVLETLVGR